MTRAELLTSIKLHVNAVQATVSLNGSPQAAVGGKAKKLTLNPKVALVIGGWRRKDLAI
jgi:hypothetical protein